MVAATDRDGADALGIAAGMRLGEAEGGALLAARHRREEALALLVVAIGADDPGDHQVGIEDAREAHPASAQLLDDPRVTAHRQAEPAELLGDRRTEEAEFLHAVGQGLRVFVAVFEVACDRHHFLLDEGADAGDDVVVDRGGGHMRSWVRGPRGPVGW